MVWLVAVESAAHSRGASSEKAHARKARAVSAVRYLFSDYPIAVVYAADELGLPAAPFVWELA